MSNSTRFFRNYPQIVMVAQTVKTLWPTGSSLDVLHIGGSTGCEAISFMIIMKEEQPSYKLHVLSTDVDLESLSYARKSSYDEEWFVPILGEGGDHDELRDRWFTLQESDGKRIYKPDANLVKDLKFEFLDVSKPNCGIKADIVFCQNLLIHMKPILAEICLKTLVAMLRYPSILVCGGMDLDMRNTITKSGLRPVTDMIREIHESWCSHRFHFHNTPGKYYFELEDMDTTREDWRVRYSSIFVKDKV